MLGEGHDRQLVAATVCWYVPMGHIEQTLVVFPYHPGMQNKQVLGA
jgi:hypothetical protein